MQARCLRFSFGAVVRCFHGDSITHPLVWSKAVGPASYMVGTSAPKGSPRRGILSTEAVSDGGPQTGELAPLLQTVQRPDRTTAGEPLCTTVDLGSTEISHSPSSRRLHTSGSTCSNAASCSSNSPVLGTCRICFETETAESQDPANPLICPCLCSGSSKYVHRQCLAQWRTTNHRADAFYQCEVCKYRYQYRRLWWAGLLGSQITLTVLYLLLLSGLIAVLGFVPVLGLLPSSKSSDSGSGGSSPAPAGDDSSGAQPLWMRVSFHIANGLIMMGVVGLAVSMVLGVLRACGYTGLVFMPDPFCPACLWCLDLNGGPGLGWAPFVECSGAAGECGLALLVILVVVMLIVGITAAAYMLYAVLWALVQQGLDKAQSMVENVQQEQEHQPAAAVAEAKH